LACWKEGSLLASLLSCLHSGGFRRD
jgi:hypothetical protein